MARQLKMVVSDRIPGKCYMDDTPQYYACHDIRLSQGLVTLHSIRYMCLYTDMLALNRHITALYWAVIFLLVHKERTPSGVLSLCGNRPTGNRLWY